MKKRKKKTIILWKKPQICLHKTTTTEKKKSLFYQQNLTDNYSEKIKRRKSYFKENLLRSWFDSPKRPTKFRCPLKSEIWWFILIPLARNILIYFQILDLWFLNSTLHNYLLFFSVDCCQCKNFFCFS